MGSTQHKMQSFRRVRPYEGAEKELLIKVEKRAFVACILAIAGIPAAFIGFGLVLGIVGLILGLKAKRPDGKRPVGAIVAIIAGILSIIIGIPGCIIMYGVLYRQMTGENSELVLKLVKLITGSETVIGF